MALSGEFPTFFLESVALATDLDMLSLNLVLQLDETAVLIRLDLDKLA